MDMTGILHVSIQAKKGTIVIDRGEHRNRTSTRTTTDTYGIARTVHVN